MITRTYKANGKAITRIETCGGYTVESVMAIAGTEFYAHMIANALNATELARREVQS